FLFQFLSTGPKGLRALCSRFDLVLPSSLCAHSVLCSCFEMWFFPAGSTGVVLTLCCALVLRCGFSQLAAQELCSLCAVLSF
ncbi:hypothetical protein Nmel_006303, partial [Mimus melanotis]